jgi:hypothetical protein
MARAARRSKQHRSRESWKSSSCSLRRVQMRIFKVRIFLDSEDMALIWYLQDDDGWTALHTASMKGWLEIVQLLLEQRADLNIQSNDGFRFAIIL